MVVDALAGDPTFTNLHDCTGAGDRTWPRPVRISDLHWTEYLHEGLDRRGDVLRGVVSCNPPLALAAIPILPGRASVITLKKKNAFLASPPKY